MKQGQGKNSGFDFASMFGADPIRYLSFFIQQGEPEMFKTIIDKVDLLKHGADCMQMACVMGKEKIVEMLVEYGVDIMNPPETVSNDEQYRRSPFIIQAAKSGSIETFEAVKNNGANAIETGCICLSKKKKNVVISNVVGAAAYHGKHKLLKYLLDKLPNTCRDFEAMEHQDALSKVKTPYAREFHKYTPLMLAIAGGDMNLDCVKALLNKGADYKCEDDQDNTVLHIAAMNGCNKILDFLAKNLKIELFKRNKAGETTLSICQQQNNAKGVQILEQFKADYDKSGAVAEELIGELMKEEEDKEDAKAKNRQKKWRQKVNRIARQENISTAEVEERLLKQELEKKAQEEQQKAEEEERERQAEIEFEKRKQEVRAKREEARKQQEEEEKLELIRQKKAELQRIEEQRQAHLEREQQYREQREKLAAEKKQRMRSRQRREEQHQDQQQQNDARPSLRKEKSQQRQSQEGRVPNHQAQAEPRQERRKSKSQRRIDEEIAIEGVNKMTSGEDSSFTPGGPHQVMGLSGELALQNMGKRERQKMRKQMQKEQEEEEQRKQRMEQLYQERLEKQRLAEEEAQKNKEAELKAAKNAKKKEKDARKKANRAEQKKLEAERQAQEESGPPKKAEVKKQDSEAKSDKQKMEWKPKQDKENIQKNANNAPDEQNEKQTTQKVYRQKAPKETPKHQESPQGKSEIVDGLTQVLEPSKKEETKPQKSKEKNQKKKEAAQKKEKKQVEETETAPPQVTVTVTEQAEPKAPEPTQQKPPKEKSVKSKPSKSVASSSEPAPQASTHTENKQIQILQQMLLDKEKELVSLHKNIDKLELKVNQKDKEYDDLKVTIDMSSSESKLKEMHAMNVQIKQQAQLNRLQASQILEFEHALWQAQKQREEAEEKLEEYMQSSAAPMATPEGPTQRSNQDLRVKQIQIRELQKSVDSLQGKATAINALSKSELTNLKDQLTQAQFNVDAALNTRQWANVGQSDQDQ